LLKNLVTQQNMIYSWLHNTQHNDIKHYDTQHNRINHNDTQLNHIKHNDNQHNDIKPNDIQRNETHLLSSQLYYCIHVMMVAKSYIIMFSLKQ